MSTLNGSHNQVHRHIRKPRVGGSNPLAGSILFPASFRGRPVSGGRAWARPLAPPGGQCDGHPAPSGEGIPCPGPTKRVEGGISSREDDRRQAQAGPRVRPARRRPSSGPRVVAGNPEATAGSERSSASRVRPAPAVDPAQVTTPYVRAPVPCSPATPTVGFVRRGFPFAPPVSSGTRPGGRGPSQDSFRAAARGFGPLSPPPVLLASRPGFPGLSQSPWLLPGRLMRSGVGPPEQPEDDGHGHHDRSRSVDPAHLYLLSCPKTPESVGPLCWNGIRGLLETRWKGVFRREVVEWAGRCHGYRS